MSDIMSELGKININDVIKQAVIAAKGAAAGNWDELREYAKKAAKDLASNAVMIAKLLASGKIDATVAKQLAEEEKTVVRMKLRTVIGIGVVMAENVLNALLGVLRNTFNSVLGFAAL